MTRQEAAGDEVGGVLGQDRAIPEDLVACCRNLAFLLDEMGSRAKALTGGEMSLISWLRP